MYFVLSGGRTNNMSVRLSHSNGLTYEIMTSNLSGWLASMHAPSMGFCYVVVARKSWSNEENVVPGFFGSSRPRYD